MNFIHLDVDHKEANDILDQTPNKRINLGNQEVTTDGDTEITNITEEKALPVIQRRMDDVSNEVAMNNDNDDVDEIENIGIIPLSELLKQYRVKRKS